MFDDFEKNKNIKKDEMDLDDTPQFIKEVIDLTKGKDPEFVKEIIDLTKKTNDAKFVK